MKNKQFYTILIGVMTLTGIISCKDWDEYKSFIGDGEKVYPASAQNVQPKPGNERLLLTWVKGIDNRVKQYKVFWNTHSDSITVDASGYQAGDTIQLLIPQIAESSYTFTIYSYDDAGNRSVPKEITAVSVYGSKYQNTLLNRPVNAATYDSTTRLLTLSWGAADTVHVSTRLRYTDNMDTERLYYLHPDSTTLVLPVKKETTVYYQSVYKPSQIAIDSFMVVQPDSVYVSD